MCTYIVQRGQTSTYRHKPSSVHTKKLIGQNPYEERNWFELTEVNYLLSKAWVLHWVMKMTNGLNHLQLRKEIMNCKIRTKKKIDK